MGKVLSGEMRDARQHDSNRTAIKRGLLPPFQMIKHKVDQEIPFWANFIIVNIVKLNEG